MCLWQLGGNTRERCQQGAVLQPGFWRQGVGGAGEEEGGGGKEGEGRGSGVGERAGLLGTCYFLGSIHTPNWVTLPLMRSDWVCTVSKMWVIPAQIRKYTHTHTHTHTHTLALSHGDYYFKIHHFLWVEPDFETISIPPFRSTQIRRKGGVEE